MLEGKSLTAAKEALSDIDFDLTTLVTSQEANTKK